MSTQLETICVRCGKPITADQEIHNFHDPDRCTLSESGVCDCSGDVHESCCPECAATDAQQIEVLRDWWQAHWHSVKSYRFGASLQEMGWDYDQLTTDIDQDQKPACSVFAVFTGAIISGQRCRSCGTDDDTTMIDQGESVCATCGRIR